MQADTAARAAARTAVSEGSGARELLERYAALSENERQEFDAAAQRAAGSSRPQARAAAAPRIQSSVAQDRVPTADHDTTAAAASRTGSQLASSKSGSSGTQQSSLNSSSTARFKSTAHRPLPCTSRLGESICVASKRQYDKAVERALAAAMLVRYDGLRVYDSRARNPVMARLSDRARRVQVVLLPLDNPESLVDAKKSDQSHQGA